jgi:hypothetical protein
MYSSWLYCGCVILVSYVLLCRFSCVFIFFISFMFLFLALSFCFFFCDVRQHFRQVAAGRALDQHRGNEERKVRRADALGHFLHRDSIGAQAVLVVSSGGTRAQRVGSSSPAICSAGRQRVTGAEDAGEEVQRFGQLIFRPASDAGRPSS